LVATKVSKSPSGAPGLSKGLNHHQVSKQKIKIKIWWPPSDFKMTKWPPSLYAKEKKKKKLDRH